jgi:PmbA protein
MINEVQSDCNKLNFSQSDLSKLKDISDSCAVDGYQISVLKSRGFEVSASKLELESIEHTNDVQCHIKVYKDGRVANSATSSLNFPSMQSCLEQAARQVVFTSPDDCNIIPDATLQAGAVADCDLYHPWNLQVDDAAEMILELSKAANALHKDVRSEAADICSTEYAYEFFDSNGFYAQQRTSRHSVSLQMIAGSGENMQTDSDYTIARDANDLRSMEWLANSAATKTAASMGPQTISSRKVPVILSPEIAAGFWSNIFSAISGSVLIKGASFLQDKLQQKIAPDWLQITQMPHIAKALASKPFDSEGVLTRNRSIIREGVLESYLLNSYSAKKLGMHSTANAGGLQNMLIESKNKVDHPAMLADMGNGILITDMMGQGVDMATGNYSRGASGFLVENGEIKGPVHEFAIAGNIIDFLQQIVCTGTDVDRRGTINCGSLLIDNVQIAGN